MASAAEIVARVQQQLDALDAVDLAIDAKIAAIKDSEWNGPLSSAQLDEVTALRAQKATILLADEELSYVTAGALDKSDEIKRIVNALSGVMKQLQASSAKIAAIGGKAQQIDSIVNGIKGLIPVIQGLIPPNSAPKK